VNGSTTGVAVSTLRIPFAAVTLGACAVQSICRANGVVQAHRRAAGSSRQGSADR